MASTFRVLFLGVFWSLPFLTLNTLEDFFTYLFFVFQFILLQLSQIKTCYSIIHFLIILLTTFNYERFSGLQEVLIFFFLIISAKILYDIKISNKFLKISLILMIANLILWIKSEGIVYAFLVTILIMNKNIYIKEKIFHLLFFYY